jgi:hypothetical protein
VLRRFSSNPTKSAPAKKRSTERGQHGAEPAFPPMDDREQLPRSMLGNLNSEDQKNMNSYFDLFKTLTMGAIAVGSCCLAGYIVIVLVSAVFDEIKIRFCKK